MKPSSSVVVEPEEVAEVVVEVQNVSKMEIPHRLERSVIRYAVEIFANEAAWVHGTRQMHS